MDVILLFPGQGSQKPGMGKDLADAFPEACAVFNEADDALGIPLSKLCFEGPGEELTETRNAPTFARALSNISWSARRSFPGPGGASRKKYARCSAASRCLSWTTMRPPGASSPAR